MTMKEIKRGDIYYAALDPVVGSEQGGTRPVLILQNDIGNQHSPTIIVAAITSKVVTKASLPTHHLLRNTNGLEQKSIILLEQIRTIDKRRLKDYVGMLDCFDMRQVDNALAVSVGLIGRIV